MVNLFTICMEWKVGNPLEVHAWDDLLAIHPAVSCKSYGFDFKKSMTRFRSCFQQLQGDYRTGTIGYHYVVPTMVLPPKALDPPVGPVVRSNELHPGAKKQVPGDLADRPERCVPSSRVGGVAGR